MDETTNFQLHFLKKAQQLTLGMHQSSTFSLYQEKLLAFLRSVENEELQQHFHNEQQDPQMAQFLCFGHI